MHETLVRRAKQASGIVSLATVAGLLLAGPAQAAGHRDTDHDGMPDRWERSHHLNWKVANARKDADHDGLSNLKEYTLRLNPRSADSDDDGTEDGYEDSDHDGLDNENDSDEVCAVLSQSSAQASDDDEQGEHCDDQGDDDQGEDEQDD